MFQNFLENLMWILFYKIYKCYRRTGIWRQKQECESFLATDHCQSVVLIFKFKQLTMMSKSVLHALSVSLIETAAYPTCLKTVAFKAE